MSQLQNIIKNAAAGKEKEQRQLYEEFRTQWYMLSMRYGKNKAQSEDIFQEGLIQIYKDLHQFDSTKAGFKTWSNRVLVNAALKYLKKHNWANTLSDQNEAQMLSDGGEDIFGNLTRKELTKLVQELPLGYRLVFNMFAIEGYTHKEIALTLEISEGTSKSQLSKARRMLKHRLEKLLISEGR